MLTLNNRPEFSTMLDALALKTNPQKDQPAIIFTETGRDDVIVSRSDLCREIKENAAGLSRLGVDPGDLVIIAHTQNLSSIYLFWAAMAIGAIPSMFPTLTEKLDPDIYMDNMAELARLSKVSAILTTDAFAADLTDEMPCPVYGPSKLAGDQAVGVSDLGSNVDWYRPNQEEIAFLQHSSGTTGLQKGVALSHQAVLNQIASYSQAIHLSPDDVVVSWLPLYHDMGLIAGFLLPLFQGIPLVLMSPFDWVRRPAALFRAIDRYHGTLCWLPNFAYNHCARRIRQRDSDGLSASSMRLFINCSEPVSDHSHRLFLDRFGDIGVRPEMLAVSYAMAENTFAVTQTPVGEKPKVDTINRQRLEHDGVAEPVEPDHSQAVCKVSCGPPIVGTAVRVLDDQQQTLEERQVGELAIRSDCMLSEYFRRPDLEPFHEGWYRTGDRGYIAGGEVYIIGRSKDLIINAGKNIYPQDIEAIVNGVEGVHPGRAVVFGVHDEREGTELVAIVAELKNSDDLWDDERRHKIARSIRQRVARQSMVTVSYVKLVDSRWLIKTSSGKIARGANRRKWLAERGRGSSSSGLTGSPPHS